MVKNELSIRSQQSYDVSMKIAEHEIKKLKDNVNKEISYYKCLVTFRPLNQDKKLFNASKAALKENVDALFANCSLSAEAIKAKNDYALARLGMTFIKTDKESIYREIIKQTISMDRKVLTTYENIYSKKKFEALWHEKNVQANIDFKIKYAELVEELYKDGASRLDTISYKDFYNNTVKAYENTKKEVLDSLDAFYPVIDNTLNKVFEETSCFELKQKVLNSVNEVINKYKEYEQISIDNIYKKIDLKILAEQTKEGLNVADEEKEVRNSISENTQKANLLLNDISSSKDDILTNIETIKTIKNKDVEVSVDNLNDDQKAIITIISTSFKGTSKEAFNKVFEAVKSYILAKCPYFFDYLKESEKKYEQENAEYRKANVSSVAEKLKSAYLNNSSNYLKLISANETSGTTKDQLSEEHKQNIATIRKEFKQDIVTLRANKKARKAAYKTQKANAKVNLKMADAAKASEIREVLKLYKKEIRTGELKRYYKTTVNFFKKLLGEGKRYKNAVFDASNPAPLSLKNDYTNQCNANKKEYNYDKKQLNQTLRKELASSRYRKDVTTSVRENKLGYIFLSIWAIGFVVLTLFPIVYTVLMVFSHTVWLPTTGYSKLVDFSFTKGITFPNLNGGTNFEVLFLNSYYFTYTQVPTFFKNLLFFVPIVVFISFVLAMLLNSKIRGRTIFRIIYFLPVVIVSGPVLNMLNSRNSSGQSSIMLTLDGSSLAKILLSISPKALQLANQVFGNFIIILWMTGVPIVLFISALQKINKQLYEAAEIDGANKWQSLWTITFPLIKSVILIVCLFTIMQVSSIGVSSVNPINSVMEAQLKNPSSADYGVIALEAWVQTIIVLLFVLASFLLFREREFISKDKNFEEMEEAKRKKNQRKAKIVEFFHINEIKNFFAKLFAPISSLIRSRKAKKKQKEEMGV